VNEAALQSIVRLKVATDLNGLVWRNNTGACEDKNGRIIRYGLCNDSAQLNARIKSSDLICVIPVTITPDMVGRTIGVFTALEVKAPGWTLRPSDARGLAQEKFHDIVKKAGGYAGFVTTPNDIFKVIGRAL